MPKAVYFKVTEANRIKIALLLAYENQIKRHEKKEEQICI